MNPKMIWSNLTAADLDRTTEFCTKLGFKSNGQSEDLTSILFGEHHFVINFFLEDKLKANVEIEISEAHFANEVIFTLSAESKNEVDDWETAVLNAGGKIISRPKAFGKDYYGCVFSDPDGHKFNVLYM